MSLGEGLFGLDDVGLLKQAHLHGDGLQGGGGYRQGSHGAGVTIASDDLGGQGVGGKAELLAHVLLDEGVDVGVGTHRAGNGARRAYGTRLLKAGLRALQGPCPRAELHAEGHGFGVDAVGAADAQHVLHLEGAALAGLAKLLNVLKDDVERLGNLIAKGGVAQVGGGHAEVNPAAGLGIALGDVGINVVGHNRFEGDDVVVGDFLDLVDLGNREIGVLANVGGFLFGDADLAKLGLSFAGKHLDFLPDLEFVLEFPDSAHGRAGVTTDH